MFGKVQILLTHRSSTTTSLRKSEAILDRPSSHAYTPAAEGQPSGDAHESSSDLATSRCQRCSTAHAAGIGMRLHAAATPQVPGLDARRRRAGAAAGPGPLRRQEHDLSRERLQRDRLAVGGGVTPGGSTAGCACATPTSLRGQQSTCHTAAAAAVGKSESHPRHRGAC